MPRTAMARALASAALLLLAGFGGGTAQAASTFDPALRFRMLPTDHFIIYFHQGEERLARRLAAIAEDTWQTLQRPLGVTPPRLTHVVLADQTELANGYATPLPRNTIVIYTVAPPGDEFDFDNWLRISFTHEFTHIVHLDRSEGWAHVARSIFGRAPYAFPNVFLPLWQIEGLATYEESVITGEGRLHAGDFRAIVNEAARQHALEPLDRVNGGLTDWPGGATIYAYGLGFHQYLADRFGADRLAALADATARSIPYLASRAFERVYGAPLGRLWSDYEASVTASLPPAPGGTATRLTHQGFSISGPRFDRFACAGCPSEIFYSANNPHGFPALYRVGLDGTQPRRVIERYLGSTTGIGPDEVYFDQEELRRNVGLYSDLYAWSRRTGRVRPVSRDARLLDPDLSPDGRTLVCVQNETGERNLVLVRLKPDPTGVPGETPASVGSGFSRTDSITTLVAEADTQFDAPRWSPDGRTIAVERHRLGAMPEVVLVDVASKAVRVLAAGARTRVVMPAWRPDGRAVVAAVAADEQTFNLVEFTIDGSTTRQLTTTTGGATWPEVSPDGRTIVFVGYTVDGSDLFAMPYPPPSETDAPAAGLEPARPEPIPSAAGRETADAADARVHPVAEYSPLATLAPTSWTPVVENGGGQLRIGAATSGYDVLGYHAYAATATWLASTPSDAPGPNAKSPDWQVYYLYARWRPSFYVVASSDTTFFAGAATDKDTPTDVTRRARQIEAGVVFPILHTRAAHSAQLSIGRAMDDYTLPNGSASSFERTPVRAAWQTVTGRNYG